MLTDY
jgi:hypothetical protein